jgi:hypothetical protein
MGNPSTGMLYVPSTIETYPLDASVSTTTDGGTLGWDVQKYLNIYVTKLERDVAGYAQMPGGPKESDGIFINEALFARKDQDAFISSNPEKANYSFGKTLAHLVGSYLNLYELWNDDQPCADDYVHDTPIHNAPNYEKPGYRHISTCGDNPVEITMNIMDNTDDEEQYMFTNGQMMRMYATLAPDTGPRAGLRSLGIRCEPSGVGATSTQSGDRESEGSATDSPKDKMTISVYPNPASDGFTVMVNAPCEEQIQLTAFNQLGSQQYSQQVDGAAVGRTNAIYISCRDWAPGMYVVKANCGKEGASAKVVLER